MTVRCTWVVARCTLRDLGVGGGAAAVILLALLALLLAQPVAGLDPAGEDLLIQVRRVQHFSGVAALAALVAAAWSVGADRRSHTLAAWMTSPVTPGDYIAGKMLGAVLGISLVFPPLLIAGLLLAPGGLLEQPELASPSQRALPSPTVVPVGARAEGAVLRFEPGGHVILRFDEVPAGPRQTLELEIHGSAPMRDPTWTAVRVSATDGSDPPQVLLDRAEVGREGAAHWTFPSPAQLPLFILVQAGSFTRGEVVLARDGVRLLGGRRSTFQLLARLVFGLACLQILAASLATALATVLPDALALVAGGLVLGLGALRGILLQVAQQAAHASSLSDLVRGAARASTSILTAVPDLATLSGAHLLGQPGTAYGDLDKGLLLPVGLWIVGAGVVGWLLLTGLRRWGP